MKQPDKWKETIDPFSLEFKNFKLNEVLGYPHARNDVFYCMGEYRGEKTACFVKYASTKETDLKREFDVISKVGKSCTFVPEIIDYDDGGKFIVTKEIDGDRLSYILLENQNKKSIDYMFEYGETLAKIHNFKVECENVKWRKFFDIPSSDYLTANGLEFLEVYLKKNAPKTINQCLCHGDFHYANILWREKRLVGVLDWELAGIGNKEFDIAWSIINRPSQKFLKTNEEVEEFLRGYKSVGEYNRDYVEYYMVLVYSHFISFNTNTKDYIEFVKNVLKDKIKINPRN